MMEMSSVCDSTINGRTSERISQRREKEAENSKVAVRNVRRDAMDELKKAQKWRHH